MIPPERIQRWTDFYTPTSSRRFLLLLDFPEDNAGRPLPTPDTWPARRDWAWRKYENQCARLETLADDRIPFLDTFTGTEIFAQAFGCPVHYPDDNMPFALPLVSSSHEAEQLHLPDLDSFPLNQVLSNAQALFDRAAGKALLRLPDLQTPMDVAALIWEKKSFYAALIEDPAAVLALAHKVQTLQFAFFDEWFRRFGSAFIAHYPDYYLPYGITVSEDEVGAVSSRMFARLFQQELHAMSERYGQIGIHCCAAAEHQWPHFAAVPNLVLLNLVQPLEVLERSYRYFEHVTAQYPSALPKALMQLTPADLPPEARMIMHVTAVNQQDALEQVNYFRQTFQAL